MKSIPLIQSPSQIVSVTLDNQPLQLKLYTLLNQLFADVFLNGAAIVTGVPCLNNNKLVRMPYSKLLGDFFFTDTQGESDPVYTGLGERYVLIYLEAADL